MVREPESGEFRVEQADRMETQSPAAEQDTHLHLPGTAPCKREIRPDETLFSDHRPDASCEDGSEDGLPQHHKLKQRFAEWRDNERELHRDHRGMMQFKPVRSVAWMKDYVEGGAHAAKERFSMRTRKPDVETEV